MQKFTKLKSKATPLPIKDVDTDMIIPADFLKETGKWGYWKNLFRRLRDQDENFPLNLEKFNWSEILIWGPNFGCGSSREHAVWAFLEYWIKVIISTDFADIFFNNSAKNWLLLIKLPKATVDKFLEKAESEDFEIEVDLKNQEIKVGWEVFNFDYDPFRKDCLLSGHDDIDYILSHKKEIEEWEKLKIIN